MHQSQQKKLQSAPFIFERLMVVSESDNLKQLSDWLNIKYGTLRSQKTRGSIPYADIVAKCNPSQLIYVLQGISDFDGPATDSEMKTINDFEQKVAEIGQRVENGPWSTETKIELIDMLFRIVETDLAEVRREQKKGSGGESG